MTPAVVDRLTKLLRVALITDKDGEILCAINATKNTLTSAGRDAHWLADAFERGAVAREHRHSVGDDAGNRREDAPAIRFAYQRRHRLSPGDRRFIEDLTDWHKPLSPAQRKWLHDIVAKLERVEGA
jgi:hypothetical protein